MKKKGALDEREEPFDGALKEYYLALASFASPGPINSYAFCQLLTGVFGFIMVRSTV